MIYTLKHYDTSLIRFSAESGADIGIRILWTNAEASTLFPLEMHGEVTAEALESWLRHRAIPRHRAYVDTLLSAMGLSLNRPMEVIRLSMGLSLNDCYWVVEEGFAGVFDTFNLYDNRFSRILGQIAFTGYGSGSGSAISSSPEFTTNGMLPKCWRREDGRIRLYKGASNTGYEPYSEFYAWQIAEVLGIQAVPYNLTKWKGRLCSTCELFTSKEVSFVPVGRLVTGGGMNAVRQYCERLGESYVQALNDMVVFDAVIYNTDRHFGNFGFLVDSRSNRIVAPAPLFDHGNSLFNYAGREALESVAAMQKYARTLMPRVYDDFVGEARRLLSHDLQNALRRLLEFRFRRHSRYNLDRKRLQLVEAMVVQRVRELLGS